jgi:hypothetical protein
MFDSNFLSLVPSNDSAAMTDARQGEAACGGCAAQPQEVFPRVVTTGRKSQIDQPYSVDDLTGERVQLARIFHRYR